jgi:hypothetical protein
VRWPGVHEVWLGGEVTARIDVMITVGDHLGVAMITLEQRSMRLTTAAPPPTPNEPPSQKSRCGSAMIKARAMLSTLS